MRLKLIIFAILVTLIAPVFSGQALAYDFKKNSGLDETAVGTGHSELAVNDGNLARTIGNFIGIALSFLGVLFLLLIIYGGFTWMMAGGNEQQTGKAKNIIINAVIGLAVVLLAYAITAFVMAGTQSSSNPAENNSNAAFDNCKPVDGCTWTIDGPLYFDMGGN